ncbi:hypothetical protein [Photobacterium damselae]|uniref:hypothetical protein n=1 Tax=Photobacterium damselae TaxID=38293 RepID=UPI003709E6D0
MEIIKQKRELNPNYAGRTVNHGKVKELLEQGYRKSAIAKSCCCTWQQVHNIAKKYGLA